MQAPEEGGESSLVATFSMAKPDRKALAALCEKPDEAVAALNAAVEAGGKVDIPCGRETCAITVGQGAKQLEASDVKFKKVSLDARGGECQMRIVMQQGKTVEAVNFYARNLGADVDVSAVPQQASIDEEIDRKKKVAE